MLRVPGEGYAPPLVLVHGLGLSARVFEPHMPALARESRLILAPDLPGFGRSDGPSMGMGVDDVAQWLIELHAALALPPAVWIGHSVAAQAVVRLAAISPPAAAALVLATPTGDRGALRWLFQLAGLIRTAPREPGWLVGEVIRHYLTTLPTRTAGTWLRSRRHDPFDDAPAIECPALIAVGGADPVVPLAFARRLRDALPDARLEILAGAAHGAALSHAAEFTRIVSEFLECLRSSTRGG